MELHFRYINARGEEHDVRLLDGHWSEKGPYLRGFDGLSNAAKTYLKYRVQEYYGSGRDALSDPDTPMPQRPLRSSNTKKPEVCFTGFKAAEKLRLIRCAEEHGFHVVTDVSANLMVLCFGENAGPRKISKAMKNNAYILTETEFMAFLETGEVPEYSFAHLDSDHDTEQLGDLFDCPEIIVWDAKNIAFVGHMSFGPGKACRWAVSQLGANSVSQWTKKSVHYVVVGAMPFNEDKKFSYEEQLRVLLRWCKQTEKPRPMVISEERWLQQLIPDLKKVGIDDPRGRFYRPNAQTESILFSRDHDGTVIAEDWYFRVYAAFRSALDISYMERDGCSMYLEGVPRCHAFRPSDTIMARNGQWAVQVLVATSDHVEEGSGIHVSGFLSFSLFKVTDGRYEKLGEYAMSQVEFCDFLKTGTSGKKHFDLHDLT